MPMILSRAQAVAAVAAATAERDGIQANLLDLDGSFGKQLLDGAALTGVSKQRWEAASAELATLWEIFTAYEAVVYQAAGLLRGVRRAGSPALVTITSLLRTPSVSFSRAPAPLAWRDITDRGRAQLTLAAAVTEMKRAFASVTDVVTAAESVWNATADGLTEIGTLLGTAAEQAVGLSDSELAAAVAAAKAEHARLRDLLTTDPLALWQQGRVDTAPLARLRTRAAAAATRAAELARLRAELDQRIGTVAAAIAAVAIARQDAVAARDRAAAKIAVLPPPPAEAADLNGRLAALGPLRNAGRWARLAAELDAIAGEAAAAQQRYRGAERAAVALLARRDELRGLLDAYQAKAAWLGAAEDAGLTARYQQARDLLWTAPCDLAAASAAVTGYQQAILKLDERRQPR